MKKLMKVLPVVFLVVLTLTNVFAVSVPDSGALSSGTANQQVTGIAKDIWATVSTIVQILAVAAVVFAGLRYMFASADQKADIKKSMGILAIGALLVFAATTIIKVVANIGEDILANNSPVQVEEIEQV